MKKIGAVLVAAVLLLSGCGGKNRELEAAMELRTELLAAEGCSYGIDITADYGDAIHSFSMDCQGDAQGAVRFRVTQPETLAGITGILEADGGRITFDDKALFLDYLTDDQLSPLSAPWIFLRTLRSGPITAAGREGERIQVTAADSYEEKALMVDFWLEAGNQPIRSEILYNGRRILTLAIRDFRLENAHG